MVMRRSVWRRSDGVIVSDLAEQGMSTRAIAPVVGASVATVKRDVAAPGSNEPPAIPAEPRFDPTPDWDVVNTETGEIALVGCTCLLRRRKHADRSFPRPRGVHPR